jgi:hypothetical protein
MRSRVTRPTPLAAASLAFVAVCVAMLSPAAAFAAASALADTGPRLAYVDPGSGSFILQALVATLAGAAVAINAYWAKIKRVFGRGASEEEDDGAGNPPSND